MGEEMLDVVNENNLLTGRCLPRSVVHAKGFWHRTVHVYVFRKTGGTVEFLTHLRSKSKDLNPDKWDTRFGGHVLSGQGIRESIIRELEEEVGIQVIPHQLIVGNLVSRDNFPNREFTQLSYFGYDGGADKLRFNDGEVQEVRWRSVDEIKDSIRNNPEKWSSSLDGFEEASRYLLEKLK